MEKSFVKTGKHCMKHLRLYLWHEEFEMIINKYEEKERFSFSLKFNAIGQMLIEMYWLALPNIAFVNELIYYDHFD